MTASAAGVFIIIHLAFCVGNFILARISPADSFARPLNGIFAAFNFSWATYLFIRYVALT